MKYEVEVTFIVTADSEDDAYSSLDHHLSHASIGEWTGVDGWEMLEECVTPVEDEVAR